MALAAYLASLAKHDEPAPPPITEEVVAVNPCASCRSVRERTPAGPSAGWGMVWTIKPAATSSGANPSGRRLCVPNHCELANGTPRVLIREAGLTQEQFEELL